MENHINAETRGHRQRDPRRRRRLRRHRRRPRRHRIIRVGAPPHRWQDRAMTLPIFVVDAFTAGPFRGNPAAVVLLEPTTRRRPLDAAGRGRDEALGDGLRDAPRRRRLRPALVHARGRGRPLRARDARERARALGGRPPRARRERRVPHPRRRAARHPHARRRGRSSTSPPRRRAVRRARGPARRARARDRPRSCRTDGEFFMLVVPDAATVRDLAPDFVALRALARRARRLRDRARRRRRARHRVALLRARGRHRRRPGHGIDALRPRRRTGASASGPTSCARTRRRRAAARCTCRVAGDRALLTGRAITVLRGELVAHRG